jgi:hypothetical protein
VSRRDGGDVERHRRNAQHLDRVALALRNNPNLAARTGAMLRGELKAPDLREPTMPKKEPKYANSWVMVRLPRDLVKRAEAPWESLTEDRRVKLAGRRSATSATRLMLLRAIEAAEAKASGTRRP